MCDCGKQQRNNIFFRGFFYLKSTLPNELSMADKQRSLRNATGLETFLSFSFIFEDSTKIHKCVLVYEKWSISRVSAGGLIFMKKKMFKKEKGNTFALLIIFIEKSLQKEQNSTNLLQRTPICRNKPAITPKRFNSLDTNSSYHHSFFLLTLVHNDNFS